MGAVWLARDEVLNRDVAVKDVLLPPELDAEERAIAVERGLREARAAAAISHPNVITVYDVVRADDRPWLVMEYLPARSLEQVLREDGALPPERVAKIGLEILSGLRAAHRVGITHRDVKPSNVLLRADGMVVLTDFGIATAAGDMSLTRSGVLLGAPGYIAPERARGLPAGPEADLWALGATLYAAVEGRPLYDRGSPLATLTAVVTEDPEPAQQAGPLGEVLDGLLRREPTERLSVERTERLLRRAARTAAPAATPDSAVPAAGSPAGNDSASAEPVAAEAGDAAPVEPEPAAAAAEPVAAAAEPAAEAAPSEPWLGQLPPTAVSTGVPASRRPRVAVLAGLVALLLVVAGVVTWLAWPDSGGTGDHASGTRTPSHSPGTPSGVPSSAAPSSPAPSGTGSGGQAAVVPAGFHRFTDSDGASLAIPNGWTTSRDGQLLYIRDPNSGRFLMLDRTDQPKPDPVKDWEQQEVQRKDGWPDYRKIGITRVDYFIDAADWEFTYAGDGGVRVHAVNRGVITSKTQAYGLFWSTTDAQWKSDLRIWQVFTSTFVPGE